jgi:hypothetical protein
MAEDGICVSCRDGGSNPGCAIRACAKEKGIEMCAFCDGYPCEKFNDMFKGISTLEHDNDLLRKSGWDAWSALQEERLARGYSYQEQKE